MRTGQAEAAVRLAASGLGVAMIPVNLVPDQLAKISRRTRHPVMRELAVYNCTQFSPAADAFAAVAAAHRPGRPPRSIVFR
jgi:DNA-binding transcriptional LysR family regulator